MVVADGQAPGRALCERPEVAAHALADRLQRFEARRPGGSVDADAFGRAVVDDDEHGGLSLAGPGRGQVGAPHLVYPVGNDGAVVGAWTPRRGDARGREQAVLAHQPQDAALGGAHPGDAQPGPDLAMTLAVERA